MNLSITDNFVRKVVATVLVIAIVAAQAAIVGIGYNAYFAPKAPLLAPSETINTGNKLREAAEGAKVIELALYRKHYKPTDHTN